MTLNANTIYSLEDTFEKYIPSHELAKVKQLLYGEQVESLQFSAKLSKLAESNQIGLKGYKFACPLEQTRAPRIVRVGIVQNKIVKPATAPIAEQREAIFERTKQILEIAAEAKVNVICFTEIWSMPYPFSTQDRYPWVEFAESAEHGPTSEFLKPIAAKHGMVIVSHILERDEVTNLVWNTAVVISETGQVIGKTRKNHIPRVKDFNETAYFSESTLGHPVFDTKFGKIGVVICYGRHHPQNWMMYGLNGAEMVFNPTANTGDDPSESQWYLEARVAAIANCYYTFAVNRVGTELIPLKDGTLKDFGYFHGASYAVAPNGSRTPGLSRVMEGLLVTELDLNRTRQTQDSTGYKMTQRLELYGQKFLDSTKSDFKPQIVKGK